MKFSIPFTERKKSFEYPSDWPSFLHNKCSDPDCFYPNAPQVADGKFNCLGYLSGYRCRGTYIVSPSTANAVMERFRRQLAREQKAKQWDARIAAQLERQKVVRAQLDEQGRSRAAKEVAAKYDEKRRLKNPSNGSANDNPPPPSLARNPAMRRRPEKPTNTTEQHHHGSSIQDQNHDLSLYPDAVSRYYKSSVDLNHSAPMSGQTSSRSRGPRSATKRPPASYEYISPQTQAYYKVQHGPSKF